MADHTTALARIAHHNAKRAERAEIREQRGRDRGERIVEKIVRSGEVFAGAAIAGVIQGRLGHSATLGPVPLDLALGTALNGLALWGVAGDHYSKHLGNFGDGFFAGYGAEAGFAVGQAWKNTGRLFGGGKVPGAPLAPPPTPGQPAVHGELDPRVVAQQIINGG